MSLRGCFGCLKFLVFVVNFIFWLVGLGVMAVSLWLLFDQQLYLQNIGAQQTDYYVGTYIILAIGAIMTLVGFLGCCGAWKESTWMLGTFFIFLLIIVLGEVFLGALLYLKEASYEGVIERSVESTVLKKYHNNSTATTQTFDLIQEGLRCCGSNGPEDWARSVFNKRERKNSNFAPEIGIGGNRVEPAETFAPDTFDIPDSCCVNPDTQNCRAATKSIRTGVGRFNPGEIHDEGCSSALTRFLEGHVIYLMGMAGGVIAIEIIGMLFSLCLCCALKRIDDFKA